VAVSKWLWLAGALAACGDNHTPASGPAADAAVAGSAPDAAIAIDAARPIDAAPVITPNVRLADTVVAAPGATGTGFGDPNKAVDGVRGAGANRGGTDVYSLGLQAGVNDSITLAWSNGTLENGPGADLVVFENPFLFGDGAFMDLIVVEVSIDGTEFRPIAHDYVAPDPTVYSDDPSLWHGFAGKTPVLLNIDTNPVDPFDAVAAGGDQLDLDDVVGDDDVARAIRAGGARFVRLVSASTQIDPHTGAVYPHDSLSNGPDIDGMYGRYVAPAAP
jgi:hypothetical protein